MEAVVIVSGGLLGAFLVLVTYLNICCLIASLSQDEISNSISYKNQFEDIVRCPVPLSEQLVEPTSSAVSCLSLGLVQRIGVICVAFRHLSDLVV